MGDTARAARALEIFYDHGAHIPGGPPGSPDEDGDRWVEIWNLVFMQYEQIDKATRLDLPKPSIDTGMGLERIAAFATARRAFNVEAGTERKYTSFQAAMSRSAISAFEPSIISRAAIASSSSGVPGAIIASASRGDRGPAGHVTLPATGTVLCRALS